MNLIALFRKLFTQPSREPMVCYVNCYADGTTKVYMRYHTTEKAALKAADGCPDSVLIFKARKFQEVK